ncbi:hypothetical protein C3941_11660 [Kaistia algarum]|uniref:LysM peptidoglycan-binding domain-containing protein n=1 Tax=Kaistia algarum TaxID=2083279 RepID=UPI000CE8D83C|nr:LysM peptidoglycan-binding domain-containing protein [Kaistia algarum]MCX5515002.1 LysM peptidoglycan-binding domain-containing protein [Kaistia algarum]PPE79744.1 hypothetical protein C3941_11660 [Kaistia algarum]
MADQTPPGPTASGRIAGVIAVVALVLGGYYAVIARQAPPAGDEVAAPAAGAPAAGSTEAAKTEAAGQGEAAKSADTAAAKSEAGNSDAAKTESKDAAAATAAGDAAKSAEGGSAAGDKTQQQASADANAKPDAKAAAGDASGAPSFDVVRVEPTGEAVVAGLAEPKATVEVLDGSEAIGKGAANERGEWAIVIEKPLGAGTHDLSIRTTSPDGKTQALSEQRVAIEVPKPGKGEALVVLNAPNEPSRVIQLPEEPKPAVPGETKIASTEPTANPAAPAADASGNDGGTAAPAIAPGNPAASLDADASAKGGVPASGANPAKEPAAAQDAASETAAKDGVASQDGTKTDAAGTEAAKTAEAAVGTAAAPQSEAANTEADKTAASNAATAAEATASKGEADKTETATAPALPPKVTVDAVEFEDGTIYIAGSAAIGGTVRIYVDGVPIGDAEAGQGGRWLLETKHDIKPGEHTVRADQINKGTGEVIVRAEVPFQQTVDVAVLAPVTAGGGASEGASGSGALPSPQNVIIRRGDNLWTISRRLYGKGVRYSTIYEANNDQIRNPHWIYPGQIFVLPAGDARWTN